MKLFGVINLEELAVGDMRRSMIFFCSIQSRLWYNLM